MTHVCFLDINLVLTIRYRRSVLALAAIICTDRQQDSDLSESILT
ncbi:hypothetical protein FAIPA1_10152 [Frankia sp. AiPs1]